MSEAPPPEPNRHDLPEHEIGRTHYLRACLFVLLGLVVLVGLFIAFASYLAFHNPTPS